jgi:hypothetical protein
MGAASRGAISIFNLEDRNNAETAKITARRVGHFG